MTRDVFSRFSQRWILDKHILYGKGDYLRAVYDVNICWYYGKHSAPKDDEGLASVRRDYEELLSEPFSIHSDCDSGCIVQDQPTWNMSECMSDKDWSPEGFHEDVDIVQKQECDGWRMENAAYYCPAHTHTQAPEEYGIHLTKRGIASWAKSVHDLCPGQPLEVIQIAAFYKLLAHEMCHYWVEEVCSITEFSEMGPVPPENRRYSILQRHFNGYIFMEEAICNTAALRTLQDFLSISEEARIDAGIPAFDRDVILAAFESVMRRCPAGYRDFIHIKDPPQDDLVFMQNFARLLIDVYGFFDFGSRRHRRRHKSRPWHDGFAAHEITRPINFFFDCDVEFCPADLYRRERRGRLWASEPPVHVKI